MLLSTPLNVLVLRALADGPKRQGELRYAAGQPAQTTLRAVLKHLNDIGAVEKHRRNRFPGVLEFELTKSGRELLDVADVLGRWLQRAPGEPLALGSNPAKSAGKALAEAWSTTIMRSLASKSLTLTELDRILVSISYPSLERRLSALRLAGLIEGQKGNGRGTPYRATRWLRESVAPLAAAAHWERRHMPDGTAPLGRLDVEAVLLLAVPLMRPAEGVSGTCRIAAEIANGTKRSLAGAMISVNDGRLESCTTKLQGAPDAWALGSSAAWLSALIENDVDGLELGGDSSLARALLDALHESLFRYVEDNNEVRPP